jgi:hypothetical protein
MERLGLVVEQGSLYREHRKQERLVNHAPFNLRANIQGIDYQHPLYIKQTQISRLAKGGWIERAQTLLIIGHCGGIRA